MKFVLDLAARMIKPVALAGGMRNVIDGVGPWEQCCAL